MSAAFQPAEQACEDAGVRVVPEVSGLAHSGRPVAIQLRVSTQSEAACTLQLDADRLLVAIMSGEEQVWSSARCAQAVPQRSLVVQPRWSTLIEVMWSGRRGCDPGEGATVAPGPYTVHAALVAGEPAASYFELKEPPPPPERQDRGQHKDPRRQT